MATTTHPCSIQGTIRAPAARMAVYAIIGGALLGGASAWVIGLGLGTELGELARSALLAMICIASGTAIGLVMVMSVGAVLRIPVGLLTLGSMIVGAFASLTIGFGLQMAMNPAVAPFWLAIAGGATAATWIQIMMVLPMLVPVPQEDL